MAELIDRECNAAIPEVDLGTDVFAFKDGREEVARIQVKTASAVTPYKDGSGYSARFSIGIEQLQHPVDRPPLYYAFAVRWQRNWRDFLIVSRAKLKELWKADEPFGSANDKTNELTLTVEFREQTTCSGRDLSEFRNAWHLLPPLQAPALRADALGPE
ncbi:MAG TPA: hypothetical protein VFI31_03300 [Pirellulales bacterium]|nr:hypothetical protein [Pirellulales bacterium]